MCVFLGAYSACINAATLALMDAGVPMKDFICSCTASLVDDKTIIGRKIDNKCCPSNDQ